VASSSAAPTVTFLKLRVFATDREMLSITDDDSPAGAAEDNEEEARRSERSLLPARFPWGASSDSSLLELDFLSPEVLFFFLGDFRSAASSPVSNGLRAPNGFVNNFEASDAFFLVAGNPATESDDATAVAAAPDDGAAGGDVGRSAGFSEVNDIAFPRDLKMSIVRHRVKFGNTDELLKKRTTTTTVMKGKSTRRSDHTALKWDQNRY
jgi:hypothetical protein